MICLYCREDFANVRATAKYCGGICRAKAFRESDPLYKMSRKEKMRLLKGEKSFASSIAPKAVEAEIVDY